MVVKMLRTNDVEVLKAMKNEYKVLRSLDHPSIIKAVEMYYNPLKSYLYMIQERVSGLDLDEYIAENGRVPGIIVANTTLFRD